MINAQVLMILLGLRKCNEAPQRGQVACLMVWDCLYFESRWQRRQFISAVFAAVKDNLFICLSQFLPDDSRIKRGRGCCHNEDQNQETV